jgi:hypothetical protein
VFHPIGQQQHNESDKRRDKQERRAYKERFQEIHSDNA